MPKRRKTHLYIGPKRCLRMQPRLKLRALMLWPDDEKRQTDSQDVDIAVELLDDFDRWLDHPEGDGMVTMPIVIARALLLAPTHQAFICARGKRFGQGLVIGLAAGHMLRRPGDKIASVLADAAERMNKALAAGALCWERRDGTPSDWRWEESFNERNLETNLWRKFGSVAHLWAAYVGLNQLLDREDSLDLFPGADEELPEFLAVAEYIRQRFEQRPLMKGGRALAAAADMYGPPHHVELPAVSEELKSVFEPER